MKAVVWTIFFASLFGMLFSSLLRSNATRELLISLWVKAATNSEKATGTDSLVLSQQFIRAVYCQSDGSLSKKKIAIITFIGSLVWIAFMFDITGQWQKPRHFQYKLTNSIVVPATMFAASIAAFPVYFALEWLLAKWILHSTLRTSITGLHQLLQSVAIGLFFYYLAPHAIWAIIIYWSGAEEIATGIPIFLFGSSLLPSVTALAIAYGWSVSLLPVVALTSSALVVSTSIVAAALIRSRRLLRVFAMLSEKIAAESHATVFNISLLLFSISTGLMQALSF